jgi:hypothetical protein
MHLGYCYCGVSVEASFRDDTNSLCGITINPASGLDAALNKTNGWNATKVLQTRDRLAKFLKEELGKEGFTVTKDEIYDTAPDIKALGSLKQLHADKDALYNANKQYPDFKLLTEVIGFKNQIRHLEHRLATHQTVSLHIAPLPSSAEDFKTLIDKVTSAVFKRMLEPSAPTESVESITGAMSLSRPMAASPAPGAGS